MFFNQGLIFLSNYEARDTKTLYSAHIHIQLLFSSLVQSNCLCVCLLERTCSLHNTNIKQWLTGTLIHIPTYILVINKTQYNLKGVIFFCFHFIVPRLIRKPLISPPATKHMQQHVVYGKNKKAKAVWTYKEQKNMYRLNTEALN